MFIHLPGPPRGGDIINLAEVHLFDLAGLRIPRASLNALLTTHHRWGDSTEAAGPKCLDGDIYTTCHSNLADANPMLLVTYPCPGRSTALSKVVVFNRQDCCQDRVTRFVVDFVNSAGAMDQPRMFFTGSQSNYTFCPSSEREWHCLPD